MKILYLILVGGISGIIGGMGMGGGTLLIPLLTIFLQFEQKSAQAINLIVFIPMAIASLIIHIKNKLVDFCVGIPVILTGIFFSVGGSLLASNISNNFLKKMFAIFLLVVGLNQGIQTIIKMKKARNQGNKYKTKIKIFIK